MHRAVSFLSIPLLLASLCACDPPDPSEPDLAVAREIRPVIRGRPGPNGAPQWRAVLVPGRLLLDSPTSAGWHVIALPPPREEAAPRRLTFANDRINLVMELGACAIAEYREALPNRAVLHWDGGRFEGCNGRGRLPAEIAGTTWELVRIGGEVAPEGRSPAATLQFGANGSLGGTLACNDGGIRTRWTANGGFVAGGTGVRADRDRLQRPRRRSLRHAFLAGPDQRAIMASVPAPAPDHFRRRHRGGAALPALIV